MLWLYVFIIVLVDITLLIPVSLLIVWWEGAVRDSYSLEPFFFFLVAVAYRSSKQYCRIERSYFPSNLFESRSLRRNKTRSRTVGTIFPLDPRDCTNRVMSKFNRANNLTLLVGSLGYWGVHRPVYNRRFASPMHDEFHRHRQSLVFIFSHVSSSLTNNAISSTHIVDRPCASLLTRCLLIVSSSR